MHFPQDWFEISRTGDFFCNLGPPSRIGGCYKERLYEGVSVSSRPWEGFHGTRMGKKTTQMKVKAEPGYGQV